MPKQPKKITISSLKRKAPKIPAHTCINSDNVIEKLEKLRVANEKLRDSGIYWYEKLKLLLKNR